SKNGSSLIGAAAAGCAAAAGAVVGCNRLAGAAAGATVGLDRGSAAGAALAAPPAAITATTGPSGAPPPPRPRRSARRPAVVDGPSIDTLSVSISNKLSPGLTASPADLNHCVILPSATVSPSCGINTSIYAVPARARHRLPRSPRHRDVLRLQKLHQPF